MKSYWSRESPWIYDRCPQKRKDTEAHRNTGQAPCNDGARDWRTASVDHRTPTPAKRKT